MEVDDTILNGFDNSVSTTVEKLDEQRKKDIEEEKKCYRLENSKRANLKAMRQLVF